MKRLLRFVKKKPNLADKKLIQLDIIIVQLDITIVPLIRAEKKIALEIRQ